MRLQEGARLALRTGAIAIICYEDLTADAQRVFHETLCPFLGVPTAALTTTLVKQNRRRTEEIVENYEEVRDLLS